MSTFAGAGSAPVVQRVRWDARSSANPAAPHPRDQPPSACPMEARPSSERRRSAPMRPAPIGLPMGPKIIGYLEANTGSQLPHRLARWEAQTAKLTRTLRTGRHPKCQETCRLNSPLDKPMGDAPPVASSVADGLFPYRTVCTTSFGSGAAFKCCVFKRFGSGVAWFVLGLTAITSRSPPSGLSGGSEDWPLPATLESQPFFPRPPQSGGRGKKGKGGVGRFGGRCKRRLRRASPTAGKGKWRWPGQSEVTLSRRQVSNAVPATSKWRCPGDK